MDHRLTRRSLIAGTLAVPLLGRAGLARAQSTGAFGLPIGLAGRVPGDGFIVRHGYACENTWYNPGWLHAGEDWYVTEGDSAGALIYAVADGEVVYADADYPGRVIIVQHADGLYSMYGHLDYALSVETGEPVTKGQVMATVLARSDGRAPSHLHFEMRTFLTTPEVNGDAPRYGVSCGYACPPGPGYWPMNAPEHPSVMGWRNPIHVIARRASKDLPPGAEVIVAEPSRNAAPLWSAPEGDEDARREGELSLRAGDRYRILAVDAGREATTETSAEGYRLWYRIALPGGARAWVQAAIPSSNDTGSDGRPSSVQFDFLPADTNPD